MKYQVLLSLKNKQKCFKLSSAVVLISTVPQYIYLLLRILKETRKSPIVFAVRVYAENQLCNSIEYFWRRHIRPGFDIGRSSIGLHMLQLKRTRQGR